MTLGIVCIVEGHGEVAAAPDLVARILTGLLSVPSTAWAVQRDAIRVPRGELVDQVSPVPHRRFHPRAERALRLAAARPRAGAVLVLCDADDDCPASWGGPFPRWTPTSERLPVRAVMACREFESWFLWGYPDEARQRVRAMDPERSPRDAKGALARLQPGYTPSVGQAAAVRELDLRRVWSRSDSFDKLVRSVAELVGRVPPLRPHR